ncbi:hypothetical protein D3C76_1678410 [compost metagenome]
MVALRGYLRQVRDGEDLAALAETPQQLAHHFGRWAADAHVHFVEHQGGYSRGLCGDDLDGQADARQLAA